MTRGPTHQFCPKCSAMLPPHLAECPRCGQDLVKISAEVTLKDVFQITGVVVLIALVPLMLMIAVALICLATAR